MKNNTCIIGMLGISWPPQFGLIGRVRFISDQKEPLESKVETRGVILKLESLALKPVS